MILRQALFFLLTFIAAASIPNPTLEKNIFYLMENNKLSYQLFQTRSGIISYSIEYKYTGPPQTFIDVPQYTLIDLQSNTVTVILSEITIACGQAPFAFDRLHYHAITSNLVYYCISNNSLLILDEEDFTVTDMVSINTYEAFDEVKLTTDGFSLAILGMKGLFTSNPAPSHLITVSMQTYEVIKHIVFDHGLRYGEAVTGYASNGKNTFVMTNRIDQGTNELSIYSMILIANNYNLTSLQSITSSFVDILLPLSEIFVIGDLIFTNSADGNFLIMNQHGTIISTMSFIASKPVFHTIPTFTRPAMVSEYGSSELYAQFTHNSLFKISVTGASYTKELVANVSDMSYIMPNRTSDPLLFAIDTVSIFTIRDLKTSQVVYTMPASYADLMVTNSTYCLSQQIEQSANLYIYSTETDALLATIPISPIYYFNQAQSILSFYQPVSNTTCQLAQVDLITGEYFVSYTFNTTPTSAGTVCPIGILHVSNNNHDLTELVMGNYGIGESYVIVSQTFGLSTFVPPDNEIGTDETLVVDFDDLTLYHFASYSEPNITSVFVYSYAANTKNFTLKASQNYTDLPLGQLHSFKDVVINFPAQEVPEIGIITLPSLNETRVGFTQDWDTLSTFEDTSGDFYAVFSDGLLLGGINQPPGIYHDGVVQTLPGVTNYTITAEASGVCVYSTLDGVITSFGLLRIYNLCNGNAKLEEMSV